MKLYAYISLPVKCNFNLKISEFCVSLSNMTHKTSYMSDGHTEKNKTIFALKNCIST